MNAECRAQNAEPLAVQELRERNHATEMEINRAAARRLVSRSFFRRPIRPIGPIGPIQEAPHDL